MADNFGPGPDGPAADNYNVDPRLDRGDDVIKPWRKISLTGVTKK